jgi:hypothetical protein
MGSEMDFRVKEERESWDRLHRGFSSHIELAPKSGH